MKISKFILENKEELIENGYLYLPPIKELLQNYYEFRDKILHAVGKKNFIEKCAPHSEFLNSIGIQDISKTLFEIAKKNFDYKGSINSQYHIARLVNPGDKSEFMRAHFDSHLFTIVFPMLIPERIDENHSIGELYFFPKVRANPKFELQNILSKIWFLRFRGKQGFNYLLKSYSNILKKEDFLNYRPLLFLGNQTLHTNLNVEELINSPRLTLLAHFFDPFENFGIGKIMRLVRKR